jgi:hypothetical protein
MTRRLLLLGAALGILPRAARAQDGPPLVPVPNPNNTCAEPFLRRAEAVDRAEQLRHDLIVWAFDNKHVISAYVVLRPELANLAVLPTLTVGGTEFRFVRPPETGVGADGLWMIVPDCGALM